MILFVTYVTNGGEFVANTTTTDGQSMPSVTGLVGGGFVITWQDNSQMGTDNDGIAVRGQVFQADGTTSGSEFLVNTTIASDQQVPSIAALSNGGFVVTWQDGSGTDDASGTGVRAQVFQADGTKSGSEFLVNTGTGADQRLPSVAALSGGGFVVAWQDDGQNSADSSGSAIIGRVFQADGTPSSSEFLANTTTTDEQSYPKVTGLSGGGFVVVWQDLSQTVGQDASDYAVRGQVFQADGTTSGSEFLANTTTTGAQSNPKITGLSNGGFVVTWQDNSESGSDMSGNAVRGQVFLADGTKSGSEFLINTTVADEQYEPSIAALNDGGFIVTWTDNSQTVGDTSQAAIRAQVLSSSGAKVGSEFLVNTSTSFNQYTPAVASLSNGGFVIAWSDESRATGDTSDLAVRAQIYSFVAPSCYLAGSLVYTKRGDLPVEQLRIGDLVLVSSGKYRPIRWIGVTTIPARLISTPEAERVCLPVIVRKGAVHKNVPSRDLFIAPFHAMVVNGVAMPFFRLTNGTSIRKDDVVRDLIYYNVELDTVDVMFVNHLPVLSLHPLMSPRFRFDNCDQYFDLYPDGAEHDKRATLPVPEPTHEELEKSAFWLDRRAKAELEVQFGREARRESSQAILLSG